ncbi:MAG: hypothetical protein R2778_12255 [Saprospiraceae bacterium]
MIVCGEADVANTELSTQQWVERLLAKVGGAEPMIILALVTGLMAVGALFRRTSSAPPQSGWGTLGGAIISVIGTSMMSNASGAMTYVAAILFAIGVCAISGRLCWALPGNTYPNQAHEHVTDGGAGMFANSDCTAICRQLD